MMRNCKKLLDEPGRVAALRRYSVLDTPAEQPFDKLTELVRNVLGVSFAAVSLIDEDRQWFKSVAGLSAGETPRDVSFCTHTIKTREPMIIPDATLDARFSKNPLVTGHPKIRSYLGVPLETPDGYNLGALCAIDTAPRTFNASQIEIMKSFAALVLNELELRQIAMSDALTGALTRRGWVAMAEKEMARRLRDGTEAAIIMFDVDHFKAVNDTYGHPAGDGVLRTLSQRCVAELRQGDT
ncbi:sensor domain-containing diguanylate cyclase, partial [Cereibacter changlensis JA139]